MLNANVTKFVLLRNRLNNQSAIIYVNKKSATRLPVLATDKLFNKVENTYF